MKLKTELILNFEKDNKTYINLLKEEDFNFKTKNILINFKEIKDNIIVSFESKNILDLKIATNAIIKSLEIISKTLKI